MTSRSEDFARGRAKGYRTALMTLWQELHQLDPRLQARFMSVCRSGLDKEFDASLSSKRISDEFLHGLCAVQGELGLLPDVSELPEPETEVPWRLSAFSMRPGC